MLRVFLMLGALGEVEKRLLEVIFAGLLPDRGWGVSGEQLAEAEQSERIASSRLWVETMSVTPRWFSWAK